MSVPAGLHTFTITATSEGGIQKTATFEWLFVDPCGPPDAITIGEVESPTEPYIITTPLPDPLTLPTFIITPTFCEVSFAITSDPVEALGVFSIENNMF